MLTGVRTCSGIVLTITLNPLYNNKTVFSKLEKKKKRPTECCVFSGKMILLQWVEEQFWEVTARQKKKKNNLVSSDFSSSAFRQSWTLVSLQVKRMKERKVTVWFSGTQKGFRFILHTSWILCCVHFTGCRLCSECDTNSISIVQFDFVP